MRWVPALVLLTALAVRLHGIELQSLWFDEALSAHAATRDTLTGVIDDSKNPPLYYLLLRFFVSACGDSEFALRCFSTFLGVVTVALAARLARREADRAAAPWAAWAAATSPLLWWASGEARMYSLMAALAVVCALAWRRVRGGNASFRFWLALGAGELALLYVHNTGPIAAVWLNAITVLAWLRDRRPARPAWRHWTASQLAVALLWLPWLAARFRAVAAENRLLDVAPDSPWLTAGKAWQAYWAGTWSVALHEPSFSIWHGSPPYLGIAGLGLLLAAAAAAQPRTRRSWLHAALLAGGMAMGTAYLGVPLVARYLVVAAPFVAVALGIGLAAWPRRARPAGALLLAAALVAAVSFSGRPEHRRDDARGVVHRYARELTSADTVMAWSYADRYDLAYYWPRMRATARRVTIPEGTPFEALAAFLPLDGRVAVNVWPTQRADERRALPCLLGHGGAEREATWPHRDMETILFAAPPALMPVLAPRTVNWPMAHLVAVAGPPDGWSSDRSACAALAFTLDRAVPVDLKARVELRNSLGMTVDRQDVLLADETGRTASQLGPGDRIEGFPLVRLPSGAPGGTYSLTVRLYDEQLQTWGYDPIDVARTGRDVPIAAWRVAAASPELASVAAQLSEQDVEGVTARRRRLAATSIDVDAVPVLRPGDTLDLTLAWTGSGPLPAVAVAATDGSWSIPAARHEGAPGRNTLDWLRAVIPVDAPSGTAVVQTTGGTTLTHVRIDAPPRIHRPPHSQADLDIALEGLGRLVGASVDPSVATPGEQITVTLVWLAESASRTPLTAFVHLSDSLGRAVGQSDAPPAAGQRPTTGWRNGEYVVDRHRIVVRADASAGPMHLQTGFYDPETGMRLGLADGSGADGIDLPVAPALP